MQTLQKKITVTKADLDQLNHVNNVRYVQWVQDIAEAHWLQNASEKLLDDYYWVLVKHTIDYKCQAHLGDTLLIKTFVESAEGVTSVRKVEIYNQTSNKLIITSETKWCLINTETNRPTRITEEIGYLFN
ncbi:MAG: acyl-CoA thioesterase [Winogradskyella sp.]|uniref:acyl-CoA thioesterase n=1 Tax=Winogradskyella sp. TaxID=1883156 RepID=UPI0017D6BAD5|nr:thioesterase family protein [Winogradskyella sp.]MBT8244382.1 acyl-CoA thioesterase [Winogradskyella sp.]NNK23305.1 acyl-CoA thioesterase [Winogradskyella sp.]